VGAAIDDGLWFDVGSPARYMSASRGLLEAVSSGEVAAPRRCLVQALQQVVIAASAVVEGQVMRSSIGDDAVVGRGCQVVDSAIWPDVRLGESAVIEGSIVGNGVFLRPGSVVRNALVCLNTDLVPEDAGVARVDDVCFVPIDPGHSTIVTVEA
jgi:NDP-sugar pyrophosphorylase family protein